MGRCHDIPALPSSEGCGGDVCATEPCDSTDVISSGARHGGAADCGDLTVSPFALDDSELALFDCWAKEVVDIAGTDVRLWLLDLQRSKRDPVYDEPTDMVWDGPYEVKAYVTKPSHIPEARDEGISFDFRLSLEIPRANFEAIGVRRLREGDIVEFWDIPFFHDYGSGMSDAPRGAKYYFDVTNVEADGHIFDGPAFTMFNVELKRKTNFTPERRIFGDGAPRVT